MRLQRDTLARATAPLIYIDEDAPTTMMVNPKPLTLFLRLPEMGIFTGMAVGRREETEKISGLGGI